MLKLTNLTPTSCFFEYKANDEDEDDDDDDGDNHRSLQHKRCLGWGR